jgi:hypothetical protein
VSNALSLLEFLFNDTSKGTYFGKKKKKRIGRPPGGHTNLENGPQKPGKRKRGRPRTRPSIFNTPPESQENKDDAESVVSLETGSTGSEKPAEVAEYKPRRKNKKRLPSAPMEMKTRGVKLPLYSHNMKRPYPTRERASDAKQAKKEKTAPKVILLLLYN